MRRLLELNLGEDGFSTLSAGDAESGLKIVRENTVDLVVTDLKLPGMKWPGVFCKRSSGRTQRFQWW